MTTKEPGPQRGVRLRPWMVVTLTLLFVAGAFAFAYQTYNFSQHTPRLCTSCHLMQGAYDTWSHSAHKNIECHSCHKATIAEQNGYLLTMVFRRPKEVPARHGRVIVPRTVCLDCHWEGDRAIPKVNASAGHAVHAFVENIECTKCHAQQVHKFLPDSKVCAQCHQETVKAKGMENHDCQLCHVWKGAPSSQTSSGLLPSRTTCLGCHAGMASANFPAAGSMKFECSVCHKPHHEPLPTTASCMKCHASIRRVGKHAVHLGEADLTCRNCHRPHGWKVTEEQAKKECVTCHEYESPEAFLAAGPVPAAASAHLASRR